MNQYIVFGAGDFGLRAIGLLGREKIGYYMDNNPDKQGRKIEGFKVYSFKEGLKKRQGEQILIAVSEKYMSELVKQLRDCGIVEYETITELQIRITKEKLEKRLDYINIYQKAIRWIMGSTIAGKGIINNSRLKKPYPEVTGYFIPTLIRWGYRDLAKSYAIWLCSIQKDDGSWHDTDDKSPYIFDSAQIIKGLLAIRRIYPEADDAVIKGCDWILSQITQDGRMVTPTKDAWGDERTCTELIHTYCLSPLLEAASIYNKPEYEEKAKKVLNYYKSYYYDEILNFNLMSHFYAYVMEAMLDLGELELVRNAMGRMRGFQKNSGAVPAYNDVDWVCSTGLFQLALVWFRLGDLENGNKAFEYGCKLQNTSGGWFGSYLSEENLNEENTYFPYSEISWAVKYFLDALYWKGKSGFERQAPDFKDTISPKDERYLMIENTIETIIEEGHISPRILDVGCGKGAYLKNLTERIPQGQYAAVDISESVMKHIQCPDVDMKCGTLTDIPYGDDIFDLVYSCEALEHAIDIESAIREMARVTRTGGTIMIIDKNRDKLGFLDIGEWEQWFGEKELAGVMLPFCSKVAVKKKVGYEKPADGLFYAWIGKVR